MSDPIRDELHRLSEEFKKLANSAKTSTEQFTENNIDLLMNKFGLTYQQAKAWLENEPNYFTTRRIFTEPQNKMVISRLSRSALLRTIS